MSTQIADNLNIPNDQWITASVSGTGNITGDRSQTLIANSSWSQVNGGVPFGTSYGSLVAVPNYKGGTSEIWNGYGGFASTYCGTESQSWNDPSIASYDARNLNGTRFTPHNPPGVPAPYPFSTTSKTFVMPPSLVEDAEAAAGQKQTWLEWAVDQGIGFIPVYGSARDAYRAYKEGDNLGLGLNVGMLGLELFTFGGASVAKGVVKSSLKAEKSLMKLGGKALKSKGDDALKLVDNKIDDVGRSLIDDAAGGAKMFKETVNETNFIIVQSGQNPRKVRVLSNISANPKCGLTPQHLKKHFFGNEPSSLNQIDPGGTSDKWSQYLAKLMHSPVSRATSNGKLDIIRWFPRADGSGFFKMGIRLSPNADGTFDLITVLTRQ